MKLWTIRRLTAFVLKYSWYYRWSKTYQYFFEHAFRKQDPHEQIPEFNSIDELSEVLAAMRWRPDTWWMLWDAISHPCATWGRYLLGSSKAGDCDDISLVAAFAIEEMRDRGVLTEVVDVGLLSVPWISTDNKTGGHNVCAFSYKVDEIAGMDIVQWAHISNWYKGQASAGFGTLKDVVEDVKGNGTSLGWAFATTGLKLIRYGKGEDLE